MNTWGKNVRMEQAIYAVRTKAYTNNCSYREAWAKLSDDEQEGFTFAQVERHLETRAIL